VRLLVATTNPGKVVEFRHILAGCDPVRMELVTPAQVGVEVRVVEAGGTYEENARLKAIAHARASGMVALADDSGLEVDALGGEPGIRSARYAGEGASDVERVRFLLAKLLLTPPEKRTARFRCVIAIAVPGGPVHVTEGSCEGMIAIAPRGGNGFGYDPVFYFPEFGKTMAELPLEIKNRVSHRARAAQKACPILQALAEEQSRVRNS
jgi:XTP/dITP diphosphohydrolase